MVVVILILAMGSQKLLLVGKIYRLKSLFLSRWWVNALGEPDNIYSPLMITPAGRAARAGREPVSQSKVLQ